MKVAKPWLAMAAMGQPETKVGDLYHEVGIPRQIGEVLSSTALRFQPSV